jgi:peptidoglycan/LPS O-acetylase OafA/YrhL
VSNWSNQQLGVHCIPVEVRHKHIPELQSIRGIAALIVLLHHCASTFVTSRGFQTCMEVVLNAHAAVMIFFVLSGYVLARSLAHQTINLNNCLHFYVGRLFRIYPALLVACAFAIAYVFLLHFRFPTLGSSPQYAGYLSSSPTVADILKNAVALGWKVIPPTWSVRDEVIASAAIPLIYLAARRGLGVALLAVTVAIAAGRSAGFLTYLPSFVIGVLSWHYHYRLAQHLTGAWVLLISIIVMIFFRRIDPEWQFGVDYNAFVPTIVESVAAAFIIISVAARSVTVLKSPTAIKLGDVSYSLYLLHYIVMSALAKLLGRVYIEQDVRPILLMATTLAVSIALAALSFTYIEKPGISLGRKFWKMLTPLQA